MFACNVGDHHPALLVRLVIEALQQQQQQQQQQRRRRRRRQRQLSASHLHLGIYNPAECNTSWQHCCMRHPDCQLQPKMQNLPRLAYTRQDAFTLL
jgi:hypothetical protein